MQISSLSIEEDWEKWSKSKNKDQVKYNEVQWSLGWLEVTIVLEQAWMGIPEKNKTVRRIYSVLQLASSALKMENINVFFFYIQHWNQLNMLCSSSIKSIVLRLNKV